MVLSRIAWLCACAIVMIVVIVGGAIVVRVVFSYSSSNRETKLEVLGGYNEVSRSLLLHIRETSWETHHKR